MDNNQTSRNQRPYTYLDAGFNRFFSRAISASSTSGTLSQVAHTAGTKEINFDQSFTSGSLGDRLQIDRIVLDGSNGRISFYDEFGVETGRVGEIDD